MTPALFSLIRFEQFALLFLRCGLGALTCYHGYPFFIGGTAAWAEIGKVVSAIGIPFHYPVFGFLGALALFFGGMFVFIGLFSRLWSLAIGLTYTIAAISQLQGPGGLEEASHALALGVVFLALFILGPGRISLDEKFFG